MSYILKALARSERERQRLRSPNLRDVVEPGESPRRRRSGLLLVLFLSANTLLLGAILFLRGQDGDPSALQASPSPDQSSAVAVSTQPGEESAPLSPPEAERRVEATSSAMASRTQSAQVPPSTRPLLLEAQPPSRPTQAPSVSAAAAPVALAAPVAPESEVLMDGVEEVDTLPGIEITVHVYADDPQSRFAYVNGTRYVEGDSLGSGGARLERITKEGIIVDLGDRRAHLSVRR